MTHVTQTDIENLRLAIAASRRAREGGNHPYGALLADADGNPLLTEEASVLTDRDMTAHAEVNLVRAATKIYDAAFLRTCTFYASAEPCAMCAGAIIWSNVRRVLFAVGMEEVNALKGEGFDGPDILAHARAVFDTAPWAIECIGPIKEVCDEALEAHGGFW